MIDPYEVLGISPNATDDEARSRYLELVRQYPPDRAPEKFAMIHAAHEALRNRAQILDKFLRDLETDDSPEKVLTSVRESLRKARFDPVALLRLGDAT